jgi:uncharacterized membrane-anchored protein
VNAKTLRLILFIALALAQIAVAARAIILSEIALRHGEVYRFRLQPVDPVDAFRGRYIALRFAEDRAHVTDEVPHLGQEKVYVPLVVDYEGFASFGSARLEAPETGDYLYLQGGVDFMDDDGERRLLLALPFRRYYITEELAKEVDTAMWNRGIRPAWVTVRVYEGLGVIEELYVDGLPVPEWLATGGPERPPSTRP